MDGDPSRLRLGGGVQRGFQVTRHSSVDVLIGARPGGGRHLARAQLGGNLLERLRVPVHPSKVDRVQRQIGRAETAVVTRHAILVEHCTYLRQRLGCSAPRLLGGPWTVSQEEQADHNGVENRLLHD